MKLEKIYFERHGLFIQLLRTVAIPLLSRTPSHLLQMIMRKSSRDAATVVAYGGSAHALEVMYTRYQRYPFAHGFLNGIANLFWHHAISQPKALRNRLRIVENLIKGEILKRNGAKAVRILNIAGGSSRAIIHALAALKQDFGQRSVFVTSIDKDANAIELGKRTAIHLGVGEHFRWIHGHIRELSKYVQSEEIDVIEIVGLLDYFPNERAVDLLRLVKAYLTSSGVLIIGNVVPNGEMRFVENVGWPQMYYRRPQELQELLRISGFSKQHDIFIEPLGVHSIIRTQK